MQPLQELIDSLYLERVRRARQMTPEEKLLGGPQLFDMACRITRAGIRHQFPDADDQQVEKILAQRIALRAQLERRR
jgi:hypothetical protein